MSQSMAERFRKQISAKNFTAMILFGAIILVFVFFGVADRLGGGGIGAAAQVNDTLISIANMQSAENNLRQIYGDVFGNDAFKLRSEALRGLIDRELMSQAARKSGIIVADPEIAQTITKDIPVFQNNGQFQRDYYLRYLEMTHQTPKDFENSIRQQQEALRVRHLFDLASSMSVLEAAKMADLKAYKMNVQFVHLDHNQMLKNFTVSAADAEKALANAEFLKKAQDAFEKNKSDYAQEEEVRAQHILVQVKPGASPDDDKKALAKVQDLAKKATSGDFGKLAAANSEDPGSKAKNGDLGFFGRGRMVKEFEEAAFTAPVGKVIGPVKTPFGYHLIKVTEKKEAQEPNFEKQKVIVAQKLLAEERLLADMKVLEEAVSKGDDAALESGLKAMNAKWDETGSFDLSQDAAPKINSQLANNALPELSMEQKLLKRIIRDGDDKYILKLKEAKMEAPVALDSMTKTMTQSYRANMLFGNWLNEYKKVSKIEVNNTLMKP
ncbi:SurA N-terminal domain-containing protein [Bdellovibrio sp. HCB337]|uniref:peptidylprolyl isomerase n=1 Tax=Bdellovibrio sp. HCB337 TaxID=3394358 RepID=UPI0039A41EB7